MNEELIKHMVNRFLGWRLPQDFKPDAGISFKAEYGENSPYPGKHQPIGTNLLDASQAEEMMRYMLEDFDFKTKTPTPSLSEGEESYHYWRECHNCGYAGNNYLHCLHDEVQSNCVECGEKLPSVKRDCDCEFSTTETELKSLLFQTRANDIERMVAIGEELVQRPNADKEHICRFNDGEQCCDCYNAAILKYQQKIKSLE